MLRVVLSLFILTFTSLVTGQDSTCVSLVGHDPDRFFIGEVTSINASTREATESPLKVEEIGVRVTDPLHAEVPGNLTLINPMPKESFHYYRFKIGETYLFDSAERDGEIWISGKFTGLLSKAGEILDLINFLAPESDGAVVYGTVKQYVGRKNFMSPLNRPIPTAAVRLDTIRELLRPGELKHSDKTTVNAHGWFKFTNVPSGNYTVTVEVPAKFEPVAVAPIDVESKTCIRADFRANLRKTSAEPQ